MTDPATNRSWQTSAAHAALLAKFQSPQGLGRFSSDYRMPALGEPPQRAVRRFIDEGFLRPSPTIERLSSLKAKELKAALKESGLKVSGRKSQLIERLLQAAPARAEALAASTSRTYGLSESGSNLVEQYLRWERERCAGAAKSAQAALQTGDLRGAVRIHAALKAIDPWGDPEESYDVEAQHSFLALVSKSEPGILSDLDHTALSQCRMYAAMTSLFGRVGRDLCQTGFADKSHLDDETAARMIIFHVLRSRQRGRLAKMGDRVRVRVSPCDDGATCAACLALASRRFSSSDIPELPHPDCRSERGCRCAEIADFVEM